MYVPETTLPDITKRLVIDLYVTATGGNRSFTFEFRDGTVSHVHTTLPVAGGGGSAGLLGVLNMDGDRPETMPRISAAAAGNTASGEVHLSFFTPAENVTISNISMVTSGTAAATVTLIRMGLYTVDGSGNVALVAQTASDTTLFNAINTTFTRAFSTTGGYPATYNLVAGTRYAVGFIVVATTRPTLYHGSTQNLAITSLEPRIAAVLASQSDLPTAINTVGGASPAYSNVNRQYYARLS